MRIIALLAVYNEERYLAACLEHLCRHSLHAYLIDNASTDQSRAIAERYLGQGLVGIETMPRRGVHALRLKLERKAQLAAELDGDWFIHMDAVEFRPPPRAGPTRRWYYPFEPRSPGRLNAWKRQPAPVDLSTHAATRWSFPACVCTQRPSASATTTFSACRMRPASWSAGRTTRPSWPGAGMAGAPTCGPTCSGCHPKPSCANTTAMTTPSMPPTRAPSTTLAT